MSADNWTICPQCEQKAEAAKAAAFKRAGVSYGKVSAEEYQRLLAAANRPLDRKETMREDYSLGVRGGKFHIDYSCSCQICDFAFSYEYKQDVSLEKGGAA